MTTPTTVTSSLGSTTSVQEDVTYQTNVNIIEFIRESSVEFIGYSLRPNRESWFYFDDTPVNDIISRPNIIVLDAKKNFKDLLNTPRETANVGGGNADIILAETVKIGTNTRTILYVREVENPKNTVTVGQRITGKTSGLFANVVSYQHNSGLVSNPSANGEYITLSLDASATNNVYAGRVISITTGAAAGKTANVVFNIGRRVKVSPSFGANTVRTDDIYSLGDARELYTPSYTSPSNYTTSLGFITGTLHFPDSDVVPKYKFRTGDRIFRVLDNPINQITTTDGDKAYTSRADYRYTTNGLDVENVQIINRTVTTNVYTISTTYFDPIAQSFFIDPNIYPQGIFVPSIDLYFKNKGSLLPVEVQIRPMVEGYPAATTVLPRASSIVLPENVVVSDRPNVQNAQTSTKFTFQSPVYLPPNQEYAFVILTNDYGYDLWVSEVGQRSVQTGELIASQPYLGSMFKSQSGRTFTALQNEDVMFNINKCKFDTFGVITFNELKNPNARPVIAASNVASYNPNVAYDFFFHQSIYGQIPGTSISFNYRTTSNTTKTLAPIETAYVPNRNTVLNERKLMIDTQFVNTKSVNSEITLRTTNRDISPIINYGQQNMIIMQNRINNLELSKSLIVIANSGTGYANGNTITFSQSTTGITAAGYVNVGSSGNITSVTITSPGAGFFGPITATVNGPPGAADAELLVSSETDPSGGPAVVRYISKTITLAEGFDSGDLRVFVSAYKPPTSDVRVYYKVRNSLDPTQIEDLNWSLMYQVGSELKYSTDSNPIEYEFTPSLTANTIPDYPYKTFNQFKIKVVLASSSTLLPDVPKIFDVRAIALPEDIF